MFNRVSEGAEDSYRTRLLTFPGETIAQEPLVTLILDAVDHEGPEADPDGRGR